MKVVIKKVGQNPTVEEIENTLEEYKKIVNGWIETFPFYVTKPNGIFCICNEEGKLRDDFDLNFVYKGDYIMGDVLFVSTNDEDFASLSDEQIRTIFQIFRCRY